MQEKFLKEDLLQYLWNIGNINLQNLETTCGQPISIIDRGVLNNDAGPDFLDGKIKIGNTLWNGNIEIHKYSSEWYKHKHHGDKAYGNVILHVVFREDKTIYRANSKQAIPCLEIHNRISASSIKAYHKLLYNKLWIPCHFFYPSVHSFIKLAWHEKLLIERLELKTQYFKNLLEEYKNDWESLLYIGIAKYLSPNINRAMMEDLALRTPLKILNKHHDDLSILEAILFGQSGLLDDIEDTDEYTEQLVRDYSFYKIKYGLSSMTSTSWKFSKMRPLGFPTIRIAQLASFLKKNQSLFNKILNYQSYKELHSYFDITSSTYWLNHYKFSITADPKSKKIGKSTIDSILINVVVPILFLYGMSTDDQSKKDDSLKLLSSISPEKNSIITQWKKLGEVPTSAFDTQALILLKTQYCSKKQCLRCDIGNAFMKNEA